MTDITLSDTQWTAVKQIKEWFKNRTAEQQVFRVFGYAGVGKSTIVKHAIEEMGLNDHVPTDKGESKTERITQDNPFGVGGLDYVGECMPGVLYGCFTGKAAFVLRKKGTPAKTIHSLIYSVHEATEEQFEDAKKRLSALEANALSLTGIDRTMADAQITAIRSELKRMKLPYFGLNEESDVRDCELLVLDEVSMVGPEMASDILSFGKPVLVLGDPGQLPPIKGEGAFTQQRPDVMLTEIHRQAGESAIIRLATMARTGGHIGYGEHDKFVWKMTKAQVDARHLLSADQVICGRNVTRLELNNAMRKRAGYDLSVPYPVNEKEKVICLKNDGSRGLINGMFLNVLEVQEAQSKTGETSQTEFFARMTTEEGIPVGPGKRRGVNAAGPAFQPVYLGHFLDHQNLDNERHDRDWKDKKNLIEATFGHAITCHKSQGSQWGNIIIWDDHLGRTAEDRTRWLYTAITRAEQGLVILD